MSLPTLHENVSVSHDLFLLVNSDSISLKLFPRLYIHDDRLYNVGDYIVHDVLDLDFSDTWVRPFIRQASAPWHFRQFALPVQATNLF